MKRSGGWQQWKNGLCFYPVPLAGSEHDTATHAAAKRVRSGDKQSPPVPSALEEVMVNRSRTWKGIDMSGTTDIPLLTKPFPPAAIKQRVVGGGKSLSYIEGHTVVNRLNAATGNCWDLEVLSIDMMTIGSTQVLRAHVRMTIPGLGSREHVGVQAIQERGGEDLVKGAVTDAIKKTASLFGVGIDLYGLDYEGHGIEAQAVAEKATAKPKQEKQAGKQGESLIAAGRERGLEPSEVRSAAKAIVGQSDLDAMPRELAVKLWAFLSKAESDEIIEAVKAGEFEASQGS
jgi:hypothetical protein